MTHDTSGGGWREFWLGLDRWINSWFGGRSLETISSRAGRAMQPAGEYLVEGPIALEALLCRLREVDTEVA